MRRREFLGATLSRLAAGAERPPNFVVLLADDLGWADTQPYGADLHETPNLNRLAREGMAFTRAYAASPVCSPTRASLLTGRHPARLHMTVWRENAAAPPRDQKLIPPVTVGDLPHSEVTIAEMLRGAGYFTAHVGKWHLGGASHYPETQGFDVNIGGTLWGAPQTYFYPWRGEKHYGGELRYVPGLHDGQSGEYLTDRLTAEALRVLDRAGQRPYFLNLWFHSPHTPIEAKAEKIARYRGLVKAEMRHQNAVYAAMVESLDENVGRVLAAIDRRGEADRTFVIFASDNGGSVSPWQGQMVTDNWPLRSGKGSLYEGGVRIPWIVRGPGVKAGHRSDALVCTTDLLPTIAELAGCRTTSTADGESMVNALQGGAGNGDRELFFHYPHYYPTTTPVSAMVHRDWKLLEYLEDGRLELFHLTNDPGESRNLAATQPDRARAMRARLAKWRELVNAQMPVNNNR